MVLLLVSFLQYRIKPMREEDDRDAKRLRIRWQLLELYNQHLPRIVTNTNAYASSDANTDSEFGKRVQQVVGDLVYGC
jgi:hypothetical protein